MRYVIYLFLVTLKRRQTSGPASVQCKLMTNRATSQIIILVIDYLLNSGKPHRLTPFLFDYLIVNLVKNAIRE